MFIDKNLMFHDDTAVTAAGEYKGDSLPVHTADELERESRGEGLEVVIQITTTFASGIDCTFRTITAPEAALTNDAVQNTTPAVPTAQLVAGKKFYLPLSQAVSDTFSYLGLMATSTGVHTAGAFSAWIQRVGEDQRSFN